RRVERAKNMHQRGLTGTRRSHDRHELAFFNRKTDALKDGDGGLPLPIHLFDVFAFDYDQPPKPPPPPTLKLPPPPPTRVAPPPPKSWSAPPPVEPVVFAVADD